MWESGDSTPLQLLPRLKQLDIPGSPDFPELSLRGLDQPSIQALTLKGIGCNTDRGDRQLRSLLTNVSWLTQIKSLTLNTVMISEDLLLQALQQLSLLEYLGVISDDNISCKTTNALS
ncbi:hypothetical protein FRB94_013957 [Tulasnella sp. JGI-2019a]|nr:hypothetical protein FRB94_013957 [Tulasnella sp. JGI-2019a]KAG9002143.1 hypothetical protein FRB93_011769 [Tulasnella sp. JGI-2019a]